MEIWPRDGFPAGMTRMGLLPSEGPVCEVRFWRDPLVGSAAQRWIIHRSSAGMTSMPLRLSEGPVCEVRFWTDPLVGAVAPGWIIHPDSPDVTSTSLRLFGSACQFANLAKTLENNGRGLLPLD